VRSLEEILATLDGRGTLDGLPFMPEMARYCGGRYRVYRRAEKTCVEGYGVRLLGATVFLEGLRCDGSAHDGCQRGCLFFWREAWLKAAEPASSNGAISRECPADPTCLPTRQDDRYFCQSTELAAVTRNLSRWNVRHFLTDLLQGEISLWRFLLIFGRMALNLLRRLVGLRKIGALSGDRRRNVKGDLNLLPGERVEVRSAEEIQQTLDPDGKNCGLMFEPDMTMYCGRKFEVDFRVERIILEETGRMAMLTNTVALKGLTCQGLCAKNCPRSNPLYWREIWLQRVEREA
jgi:hypothetical protein